MHIRLFASGVALALAASTLHAQQPVLRPVGPQTVVPVFGFSVGTLSIDTAAAANSLVGKRAWGIQLDGGAIIHDLWFLGADVGGQFLDDKAQFTQNTTGGQMKSNASVTYFSALGGIRSPNLGPLTLALNLGATATVGRRSIDNCVDCHVDNLTIPGGGFVEPTILLGSRNFRMRITGRTYLGSSGMKSIISVGGQLEARHR